MPFPAIDPVLVEVGPFAIRWYALAYIGGILLGWWLMKRLIRRPGWTLSAAAVDDVMLWVTLGIILGGRLGYVLFYQTGYYFSNPLEIAYLWQGGMSFHGGLVGVIVAIIVFSRRRGAPLLELADAGASVAPIGLFFGRLANFINGELWGRASDVPWAMVFPGAGPMPRHPSQLYEAALEGLVLLAAVQWLAWRPRRAGDAGKIAGVFMVGYALARSVAELFREPDVQIGYLAGGVTMGQLLCLPMFAVGLVLLLRVRRHPASAAAR